MSLSGNSLAEALRSLTEALRSRSFRRYSGLLILQGAGKSAQEIAVLWLVYKITGTALSVGFAVAVGAGSQAALSPLAGVLIDRVNRRRLLVGVQGTKAVIVGGLAAVVFAEGSGASLWLLYAVITTLGMILAIDKPLRKAFVRDVVSAGGLESATRLFTPLSTVGRIAGSALAALMLTLSMPWACFALNSAAAATTTLLVLKHASERRCDQRDAEKGQGVDVGLPEVHSGSDSAAAAADLLLVAGLEYSSDCPAAGGHSIARRAGSVRDADVGPRASAGCAAQWPWCGWGTPNRRRSVSFSPFSV